MWRKALYSSGLLRKRCLDRVKKQPCFVKVPHREQYIGHEKFYKRDLLLLGQLYALLFALLTTIMPCCECLLGSLDWVMKKGALPLQWPWALRNTGAQDRARASNSGEPPLG